MGPEIFLTPFENIIVDANFFEIKVFFKSFFSISLTIDRNNISVHQPTAEEVIMKVKSKLKI